MVLRGIFLADQRSQDHFTNEDIGHYYQDAWNRPIGLISLKYRSKPIEFSKLTTDSPNPNLSGRFAFEYVLYGLFVSKKTYDLVQLEKTVRKVDFEAYFKIQLHYVTNHFFIPDQYILNQIDRLKHIPIEIVPGSFDVLCPLQYVMIQHKALPKSQLIIVDAIHAPTEMELESQMVRCLNLITEHIC